MEEKDQYLYGSTTKISMADLVEDGILLVESKLEIGKQEMQFTLNLKVAVKDVQALE